MRFEESGSKKGKTILLLAGDCGYGKSLYEEAIPYLQDSFHVVTVLYDGYDGDRDTLYPDMVSECELIEAWVQKHYNGRIDAVYGSLSSGKTAALLAQRQKIRIKDVILGSTDLRSCGIVTARIRAELKSRQLLRCLTTGTIPDNIKKMPEEKRSYQEVFWKKMYRAGDGGLRFVRKKSLYNQIVSAMTVSLPEKIEVFGTSFHLFYSLSGGKKDLERYHACFPGAQLRFYKGRREELLLKDPRRWAASVKECVLDEQ